MIPKLGNWRSAGKDNVNELNIYYFIVYQQILFKFDKSNNNCICKCRIISVTFKLMNRNSKMK